MGEALAFAWVLGLIAVTVHLARKRDHEVAATRATMRKLAGRAEVLERAAQKIGDREVAALFLARARGLREDVRRAERKLRRLGV